MNDITYVGKHSRTNTVNLHAHAGWELIYCTGGSGALTFGSEVMKYHTNDVVVIPPLLPHSNMSEEGFTNYHVNMADVSFSVQRPLIFRDEKDKYILNAFEAAYFYYTGRPEQRALMLPAYGRLLATYIELHMPKDERSDVVRTIEHSIIHNLTDASYDLTGFLKTLPFSSDYLNRLFKKEIGITPHRFLMERRLQAAADYIAVSDNCVISEVAEICGFNEPLYFSRMFKKKYGVAPSYYRPPGSLDAPVTDSDRMKLPVQPR